MEIERGKFAFEENPSRLRFRPEGEEHAVNDGSASLARPLLAAEPVEWTEIDELVALRYSERLRSSVL